MSIIGVIDSIRKSVLVAICVAVMCLAAPAISVREMRADYACQALVVDPASAANLDRPYALRYRTAPLRVCVPANREPNGPFASV